MPEDLPPIGTAPTERLGIAIVSTLAHRRRESGGLGCIFREQQEVDRGIDGHFELLDEQRGRTAATGKCIGLQIKCGPSYFAHDDGEAWSVWIPSTVVHYWRNHIMPVLLLLVNPESAIVYWVRGDVDRRHQHGDTYRIRVPKSQVLGPSSHSMLAAIANEGRNPLARAVDSPTLLALRSAVFASVQRMQSGESDWLTLGVQRWEFGEALMADSRSREGLYEQVEATLCWRRAGQPEHALERLAHVVDMALTDLCDGSLAHDLAVRGLGDLGGPGIEAGPSLHRSTTPSVLRVRVLQAEGAAMAGDSHLGLQLLNMNAIGADSDASQLLSTPGLWVDQEELVCRLRARLAQGAADHTEAARNWNLAATAATNSVGALYRVRALLSTGLGGDTAAAIAGLRAASASGRFAAQAATALAWLLAETGGIQEALAVADRASTNALGRGDALAAFRASAAGIWVLRHRPLELLAQGSRLGVTRRLREAVEAEGGEPLFAPQVLERAETALAENRLREGCRDAVRALFAALDDCDPSLFAEARRVYARSRRLVSQEVPDSAGDLISALSHTIAVRASMKDDEANNEIVPWLQALLNQHSPDLLAHLVAGSVAANAGDAEVAGAVALLADLSRVAPQLSPSRRILRLVARATGQGWGGNLPDLGTISAGRVFSSIVSKLSSASIRPFLDRFLDTINSAPPRNAETVFTALIGGLERFEELPSEIEPALLAIVEPRDGALFRDQRRLVLCLAALLAARGSPVASAVARGRLDEEVRQGRWDALGAICAYGLQASDEDHNRYLEGISALLDTLIAQSQSNSLGFGARDEAIATRESARRASVEWRESVSERAVRFALGPGHLLVARMQWIRVIAQLGSTSGPDTRGRCLDALRSVAAKGLTESREMGMSNHPLAAFRFVGPGSTEARVAAIDWVALFVDQASTSDLRTIETIWSSASHDPDPDVRRAVAQAVSEVLVSHRCPGSHPPFVDAMQTIVLRLARDPSEGVRDASIAGLLAIADQQSQARH